MQHERLSEKNGFISICNSLNFMGNHESIAEMTMPLHSNVTIVPGSEENKTGVPFCGPSGQLLDEILSEAGLSYLDVLMTNVVHTRPPNNKTPSTKEVRDNLPRLLDLLLFIKPRIVICLGSTAANAVRMIRHEVPDLISNLAGKTEEITYKERRDDKIVDSGIPLTILYTFHPASALPSRHPEKKDDILNHINRLRTLIESITGRSLISV